MTPDPRGAWPSYLDLGAKLDDAVRRKNSVGRVAMRARPEYRRSRDRAIPGRGLDLTLRG